MSLGRRCLSDWRLYWDCSLGGKFLLFLFCHLVGPELVQDLVQSGFWEGEEFFLSLRVGAAEDDPNHQVEGGVGETAIDLEASEGADVFFNSFPWLLSPGEEVMGCLEYGLPGLE